MQTIAGRFHISAQREQMIMKLQLLSVLEEICSIGRQHSHSVIANDEAWPQNKTYLHMSVQVHVALDLTEFREHSKCFHVVLTCAGLRKLRIHKCKHCEWQAQKAKPRYPVVTCLTRKRATSACRNFGQNAYTQALFNKPSSRMLLPSTLNGHIVMYVFSGWFSATWQWPWNLRHAVGAICEISGSKAWAFQTRVGGAPQNQKNAKVDGSCGVVILKLQRSYCQIVNFQGSIF